MKCLNCGCLESKVIDSRLNDDGTVIRRRRECVNCGKRFTTYECIETMPLVVIKKDGSRQLFESAKIKTGILKACEKRPVSISAIDKIVLNVQKKLSGAADQEVPTSLIGDLVMEELKDIDEVAYVRYASVHRQFRDINTLLDEIERLVKTKEEQK